MAVAVAEFPAEPWFVPGDEAPSLQGVDGGANLARRYPHGLGDLSDRQEPLVSQGVQDELLGSAPGAMSTAWSLEWMLSHQPYACVLGRNEREGYT